MSEMHHFRITELALKALENLITPQEFAELDSYIAVSKEDANYFVDCLATYMALSDYHETAGCKLSCFNDHSLDQNFWKQLSEAELCAPAIKFDKTKPQLVEKVIYPPREKRKISKLNIFVLFNAAAVLLIVLFARFLAPQSGVQVATLAESIDAKWADAEKIVIGQRFVTGSTNILLREGCAELLFDNRARITVEAPTEFQILTGDQIKLNYGRVYATVPEQAYGFTVSISNGKVIDLGTEFGIQRDPFGNTELHVIKGRTTLIANTQGQKINISVAEGAARKLSGVTGEVETITLQKDIFVRKINSKSSLLWKGQGYIDLADVVGGGNGFGTGQVDMTTDPISGNPSQERWGRRESANDYHAVSSSPYIDGVFIPNGKTRQVISSQGHLFQECPVTSGLCCDSLVNARMNPTALCDQDISGSDLPVPVLLMHANMGITFDLQAMRNLLPHIQIVRFQCNYGIQKWSARPSVSNADFWVLVDGELRHQQAQVKANSIFDVNIELSENDRFLTLIETDGGDPSDRVLDGLVLPSIDSDWGMFVNPQLVLE